MGKMKEMLEKAVQMGSVAKFNVVFDYNSEQEAKEMSYIELGMYLVSNEKNIDEVHILLLRD